MSETVDMSWTFATYCLRCDARYDLASEKLWCGDTASAHQWRRDTFRGLLDLIKEAGAVPYIHDSECAIRCVGGACDKRCGERAYEAARPAVMHGNGKSEDGT